MKNMSKCKNLIGQKFGRLTVIGLSERQSRKTYWVCQCDCGNISEHRSDGLLNGSIKSCGCYKREISAENVSKNHTHKQSGTRLYQIWQGLKGRCYDINDKRYERYGGRGITVCDEWKNDFTSFYRWAIDNGYDETLTIDRINNNGNYEPSNCRWATFKEQANNRSSNIHYKIGNVTKSLSEWCELFGLPSSTILARYSREEDITMDKLFRPIESQYRGNQSDSERLIDTVERRE